MQEMSLTRIDCGERQGRSRTSGIGSWAKNPGIRTLTVSRHTE